jgi:Flp pilus assembly protein TadG
MRPPIASLRHQGRAFCRDENGSALVEGAVLIPLLVILFLGVFEFSWFFYQQHVASLGIRDGARYLARTPNACATGTLGWNLAETYARNLAATGSAQGGAARVNGWTAAMVTIRCTPVSNPVAADGLAAYRGRNTLFVVTVSTRFSDPSLGFFGLLGLEPPAISVAHSERVIGPG